MRLQRFLDVSQACDLETFERRLVGFANELNFGIAAAALVVDQPGKSPSIVGIGNTPQGFAEASRNESDIKRDPVIKRMKALSVPFIYNQDLYVSEGAGDLWEQQAPYGYRTGISVALHLPGHKHFLLGVDRDESLPAEEEKLIRLLADLQFLAVHAQDAALRLMVDQEAESERPVLSEREIQILRLTMDGKSAWVAGQLMSISESTVNYHLQSINRKLHTSSKHQAALKALSLGLL